MRCLCVGNFQHPLPTTTTSLPPSHRHDPIFVHPVSHRRDLDRASLPLHSHLSHHLRRLLEPRLRKPQPSRRRVDRGIQPLPALRFRPTRHGGARCCVGRQQHWLQRRRRDVVSISRATPRTDLSRRMSTVYWTGTSRNTPALGHRILAQDRRYLRSILWQSRR